MATLAPDACSVRAMTAPMRFAAPVTRAHCPSRPPRSRFVCRLGCANVAPFDRVPKVTLSLTVLARRPMSSANDFPAPAADAQRASDALAAEIRAEIERAGGWLDFARYMQLALYAPGSGYYSGGSTKFGATGDFVTAPELSGALGRALARTLEHELGGIAAPAILELGAGSGALAGQILDALAARGDTRAVYRILEPSADLRDRQRQTLQRFGERVAWLERLPETPFEGAIVANEVADALPVACFVKRAGRARPLGVELHAGRFAWAEGPDDPELAAAVESIELELERLHGRGELRIVGAFGPRESSGVQLDAERARPARALHEARDGQRVGDLVRD